MALRPAAIHELPARQGGRMIPNGTFDALLHYVADGRGLV
jgi:hypothetical protein